jgi:hypothetical protein
MVRVSAFADAAMPMMEARLKASTLTFIGTSHTNEQLLYSWANTRAKVKAGQGKSFAAMQ